MRLKLKNWSTRGKTCKHNRLTQPNLTKAQWCAIGFGELVYIASELGRFAITSELLGVLRVNGEGDFNGAFLKFALARRFTE